MTSFDVGLQSDTSEFKENFERVMQFDSESYGYLCFMIPFFEEAAQQTGQYIQREGDAVYGGPQLAVLEKFIDDAQKLLEEMPAVWKQHVFTSVSPNYELLYAILEKQKMGDVIELLRAAIHKAQTNGLYIMFWD